MYGAAPANWYGLSKLMEFVSEKINVKIGTLTTISASAHIYERDWPEASKIIGKYPMTIYSEKRSCRLDPKGYFLIKINHKLGEIILEHYNNQNELLYVIKGKNSEEISHELANHTRGLRPEHYIYLGRELMKAEMALKYGLKYIQDKELVPLNTKRSK